MKRFRRSEFYVKFAPILLLVIMCLVMTIGDVSFLSIVNFETLSIQMSVLLVIGIGMTFVILMGAIDLSVGAVVSCSAVATAISMRHLGYIAFPLAILTGSAFGFLNGLIHTRFKIPSFMATLGTGGIALGVAYRACGGTPVDIPGTATVYRSWVTESILGLPNITIIAISVLFFCYFLERYTRFGRYVYAIGGEERVARLSGIPVDKYKIFAFILCGACAGLGGALLASRIAMGAPKSGEPFLLLAIAAVVVGGTAITGGVGGVFRTLVGALTITILRNGMNVVGVYIYAQQMFVGLVTILAVIATINRLKIPIIK